MLFNIFINDKDMKIVCTLNKFADDTMISIAVDTSEEHDGSGKYLKIESTRISWNSINPREKIIPDHEYRCAAERQLSTKSNRSLIGKSRVTECYASHENFALAEVTLTEGMLCMNHTLWKDFLLDMQECQQQF
ncbi:hypothetical protein TURU_143834 [Turdus rufiventris]|nr:hypothetical protein TURU_143834 [Turdus rufiventris]